MTALFHYQVTQLALCHARILLSELVRKRTNDAGRLANTPCSAFALAMLVTPIRSKDLFVHAKDLLF
jgi:hypothetical protein